MVTGFFFSIYLTQPVAAFLAPRLGMEMSDYLLSGVAFVLGLTAMNVIPAVKAALAQFVATRGA
ncbi:hypothetical protein D3C77_212670 [compost metagenome]